MDTEFIIRAGERPSPVCLCAVEVRTGETRMVWLDDGARAIPPIPLDEGVLYVTYSARAELCVHLVLRWPLPVNILDLHVEHLRLTNGRRWETCKLTSLCRQLGFPAPAGEFKEQMRDRIIQGPPFTADERGSILSYCLEDARMLVGPLQRLFGEADIALAVGARGEFMRVAAQMDHLGIPIDVDVYEALRRRLPAVWQHFVTQMDEQHLYQEGHFKHGRLDQLVQSHGLGWPRTEHGNLRTDEATWETMAELYPDLVGPYAHLRKISSWLREGLDLQVGADGRSRPKTMPYIQKAGRTSPSGSFIFSHPKWLRGLLKPLLGTVLLYADYSQQEPALAAFLSGDAGLRKCYHNKCGSFYVALMVESGLAPATATKKTHPEVHNAGKVLLLAISYGAGPGFVASRLGRTVTEAKEILRKLRAAFPAFFAWRDEVLLKARLLCHIETQDGWCQAVDSQSNPRSIYNYPMQSTGGTMIRCAAILASAAGFPVLATVHDALVCEADVNDVGAQDRLSDAMNAAAELLAPGFGVRHEIEAVRYPGRYIPEEPSAREFWNKVVNLVAREEGRDPLPWLMRP